MFRIRPGIICKILGHKPGKYRRQLATPPSEWLWSESERERRLPNGELAHPKGFLHPGLNGYLPDHDITWCQRCYIRIDKYDNEEDEKFANLPLEIRREYFRKLGYS